MFYTTISSRTWCFPEIAGCLGHFSASEIASDAPPIASAAELQSHRRIPLGLTERFSKLIKIGCVFQNGGCSEMGFHSRSEHNVLLASDNAKNWGTYDVQRVNAGWLQYPSTSALTPISQIPRSADNKKPIPRSKFVPTTTITILTSSNPCPFPPHKTSRSGCSFRESATTETNHFRPRSGSHACAYITSAKSPAYKHKPSSIDDGTYQPPHGFKHLTHGFFSLGRMRGFTRCMQASNTLVTILKRLFHPSQ